MAQKHLFVATLSLFVFGYTQHIYAGKNSLPKTSCSITTFLEMAQHNGGCVRTPMPAKPKRELKPAPALIATLLQQGYTINRQGDVFSAALK